MTYDLIIIGGGPAGIAAGIYASRQKLNTLLITKKFGGQMARKAVAIENYPGFEEISGLDLMEKFVTHLKKFNVEIIENEVTRIGKLGDVFGVFTQNRGQFSAKAVIVASGADPRPLEVPGEKEFIGKGVSYCPACDGPIFKDKTVAVVGGGDAGFETAIFLTKYAPKIYILEAGPDVKAGPDNQYKAKISGKIEILTNVFLREIKGDKFVNAISYTDGQSDKLNFLQVDGVFVEIGNQPATSFVKDLVDFNERDEIITDLETYQTKTPGLFAVGDVNVGKFKQIVIAAGEGAKAALAAYDYLQKQKS